MKKLLLPILIMCLTLGMPYAVSADPATSITSYWKLDESSGNAADSVGSNTLTNTGSMTYGTGKINNGASIASGKYLTRTSAVISTFTNISVCLWANIPTTGEGGGFFRVGNFGGSEGFGIGVGNLRYDGSSNGNKLIVLIDGIAWRPFTENVGTGFHFLCATRGASVWHGYIDGVVSATTFSDSPNAAGAVTYIGRDQGQFVGVVDEVGVWTQELSQADITCLYNSGTGKQYPFTGCAAGGGSLLDDGQWWLLFE